MKKSRPFRICHCGQTYTTELDVYKQSIPVGLQEFANRQFELRNCPKCGTTFTILFWEKAVQRITDLTAEDD
ncbi:MAG: hypothetical protein NTZ80_01150 [Patescibacteria group bacterium]|nr:hypothetical protein [Patescibacteria group bacterium]